VKLGNIVSGLFNTGFQIQTIDSMYGVSQPGVVDACQMQDGRVQVGMNLPPLVCRVLVGWAVRTQPALPVMFWKKCLGGNPRVIDYHRETI
jgi:hypothetical protein